MRLALLGMAAMLLAGCAVTPRVATPAAVLASAPAGLGSVAADAAGRLAGWHPPGATRWVLQRPATDAFGLALVDRLRREGYAVEEAATARGTTVPAAQGAPLDYVFEPLDAGVYRLSLRVGPRTLSRAYRAGNAQMAPIGAWSHGE